MENGSLQISKDLDGAEELIEVIGQTGLRVAFMDIGEEVKLGFFPLWFRGKTAVHVQEPVANEPTDGRDEDQQDQESMVHYLISQSDSIIGRN